MAMDPIKDGGTGIRIVIVPYYLYGSGWKACYCLGDEITGSVESRGDGGGLLVIVIDGEGFDVGVAVYGVGE